MKENSDESKEKKLMEQTKASMGRKTVSFLTIVTIAGTMYTLYGVQSTFYVQF